MRFFKSISFLAKAKFLPLLIFISLQPIAQAQSSSNDPLSNNSSYIEGYALIDAKAYKEALSIFDGLIKSKKVSSGTYFGRGRAYHELGNNQAALEDYKLSIIENPLNAKAHSNLGLVYGSLKDFNSAIKSFNRAIEINPKYDHAYSNRGVAKGASGDINGAISDFTKSINSNPNFADAWANRGITLEITGDQDGACRDWKKAAQLGRKDAQAWVEAQCI